MPAIPGVDGTYWLYTVLVDAARFGMDSRQLLRQLQEQGIQSRPLWQPLHLSQPHRDCQFLGGGVTDRLYADGLSLPCSVDLSPDDQARVVRAIARAAGQAA